MESIWVQARVRSGGTPPSTISDTALPAALLNDGALSQQHKKTQCSVSRKPWVVLWYCYFLHRNFCTCIGRLSSCNVTLWCYFVKRSRFMWFWAPFVSRVAAVHFRALGSPFRNKLFALKRFVFRPVPLRTSNWSIWIEIYVENDSLFTIRITVWRLKIVFVRQNCHAETPGGEQYCNSQGRVVYCETQNTNYPNLFHRLCNFSALQPHVCCVNSFFFFLSRRDLL